MQLIRSLVIAFSMYSSLPMPDVAWDRDAMRWSLCFFPLVGAVIGLEGRLQSRNYIKVLEGKASERTAYEVSIATAQVLDIPEV